MSVFWGFRDDGMIMEGSGFVIKDVLEIGVKKVRIDLNIDVCFVLLLKKKCFKRSLLVFLLEYLKIFFLLVICIVCYVYYLFFLR